MKMNSFVINKNRTKKNKINITIFAEQIYLPQRA